MSTRPRVRAIHGAKRSGKGTVAARLCAVHGHAHEKFAAPLKAMMEVPLRVCCGFDAATIGRCLESDLKEVAIPALGGKSTRFGQQYLGTEWRNLVCGSLWRGIAIARTRAHLARGVSVAIDDLRFFEEVEDLRGVNADLWVVRSPVSRGDAPVAAVPWNLRSEPRFAMTRLVAREMTDILLAWCGCTGAGDDDSVVLLGGKTPRFVLESLMEAWVPMMLAPPPVSKGVHASEAGLPDSLFSQSFCNRGTVGDLNALVDAAVAAAQSNP